MSERVSRRNFLRSAAITAAAGSAVGLSACQQTTGENQEADSSQVEPLNLGLVTYNLAQSWDVDTIIENCTETEFEAVELRATHAHGVEVDLSEAERREVRRKFEDSPVTLASLGSAFEYDSPDEQELRRNIEGTKEYAVLAHDVGANGIKVRPNRLHVDEGIEPEVTLRQIGESLRECAEFTQDYGIELRLETHGDGTARIRNIKKIMDYADHDYVTVCWNCNPVDLEDDGLEANFNLVKDKIHFVHMRDLYFDYPFHQVFAMLQDMNYDGYCCAEIPDSSDPLRVMRYYRALFLAFQGVMESY
jgi:sugar phosphate isomerase/epimerase